MFKQTKSGLWAPAEPKQLCMVRVNQGTGAGVSAGTGGVRQQQAAGGGGGGLTPPEGATGWLKLDDATPGESSAFPTVANLGSVAGDWARNGTGATLQTVGGPNGMKYAQVAASSDYLKCGTKTNGDFVTTAVGTFGMIFRHTLTGTATNPFFNSCIQKSSDSLLGIAGNLADGKIVPFYRGGSVNHVLPADYTSNTWRALVMRWERNSVNKLFVKLNGGAWSEMTLTQNLFATTGVLRLFDDESGTSGIAEWLAYASQSEEMGDALLSYLAGRGGF